MAYLPDLGISPILSSFGARLVLLEGRVGPVPVMIQYAMDRLGVDFRTKGPRVLPIKTPLLNDLPNGASFLSSNPSIITTAAGSSVLFAGWDLTGYTLFLTQGDTILRDTRMARGDGGLIDRRGTATLTAEWCDFDGLQRPWTSTMIINNTLNGFMTIRDSKVRDSGVDLMSVTTNLLLERCWLYGGGYTADTDFHFDGMQLRTSQANYGNIAIRDCLLDATGPRDAASIIRFVTENGATLNGVDIERNVMNRSLSPQDVPIAIGAKPAGGTVSNIRIRDNWLRYGTSSPIYPYDVPSVQALWRNNRQLETNALIDTPMGWST